MGCSHMARDLLGGAIANLLLGYVRDVETNSGIAGAKVTVGQSPVVQTDVGGHFPLSYLPDTEIDVRVEKDGYQTSSQKFGPHSLFVINMWRKKK